MQLDLTRTLLAAGAVLALSAMPAFAEELKFTAVLNGASEVPATTSTGTGTLEATLDTTTKTLAWTLTYKDLTGDPTAAHFHGPAAAGATAPPVVPIDAPLASPIKGQALLTDAQITELKAEQWYVNVHTAKFPDGEIRGQVMAAKM